MDLQLKTDGSYFNRRNRIIKIERTFLGEDGRVSEAFDSEGVKYNQIGLCELGYTFDLVKELAVTLPVPRFLNKFEFVVGKRYTTKGGDIVSIVRIRHPREASYPLAIGDNSEYYDPQGRTFSNDLNTYIEKELEMISSEKALELQKNKRYIDKNGKLVFITGMLLAICPEIDVFYSEDGNLYTKEGKVFAFNTSPSGLQSADIVKAVTDEETTTSSQIRNYLNTSEVIEAINLEVGKHYLTKKGVRLKIRFRYDPEVGISYFLGTNNQLYNQDGSQVIRTWKGAVDTSDSIVAQIDDVRSVAVADWTEALKRHTEVMTVSDIPQTKKKLPMYIEVDKKYRDENGEEITIHQCYTSAEIGDNRIILYRGEGVRCSYVYDSKGRGISGYNHLGPQAPADLVELIG